VQGKSSRRKLAIFTGLALGAVFVSLFTWFLRPGLGHPYDPTHLVQQGEIGFVVTNFEYVLGPDRVDPAACPDGLSRNVDQIFQATVEGQRLASESDKDYSERVAKGGRDLTRLVDGRETCQHPELAPRDPQYRTVAGTSIRIDGLDLDGTSTPGSDFAHPSGRGGVDNQFFRAVGCNSSYQPTGQSNAFDLGMYAGEWGILVRLSGVDDLVNDDEVRVGIYANADPIALSPTRDPLEFATYALDQDPRFRAETTGRIRDGVLTTDPVDVRFPYTVNSMYLERPLRDARIVADVGAEGTLSGILGGYVPVVDLFDYQFGYRNAKKGSGEPADANLRDRSANGAARALGHTCGGVWQALNRLADGHPDPVTGRNTSVSTQYRFEAVNAFLVDADSGSGNDELVEGKAS
jgi:hypothetical protein